MHDDATGTTTFADLGLDFPLLECPVDCINSYSSQVYCCIRQQVVEHAFRLGVGDYVRRTCSDCGRDNYLRADDAEDGSCRDCDKSIPFPEFVDDVFMSYEALRNGDGAITTDTEFGMISWEQAKAGKTHGIPGLEAPDLETIESESGWTAVKLPPISMWELLQTPNYSTWQGEKWRFDGDEPMVYLGEWKRADFNAHAPNGDGFEWLFQLTDPDSAEMLWENIDQNNTVTTYVFRSQSSEQYSLHWDYT